MNKIGLKNYYHKGLIEAGCDEAGRGCLAGPVVAAAVILPIDFKHDSLNDSKQITEKVRNTLRGVIEQEALAWEVAFIDNNVIDEINILKASIKAMHCALDGLDLCPEHILVDGNRFYPYKKINHTCVVKGDSKYKSIAAASVLAKTYRDAYMQQIGEDFKEYYWGDNKGYPTKKHREAIKAHGVTRYHRKTFQLLDKQLEIKF